MAVWTTKSFRELTIDELYEIIKLRSEVFMVEEGCRELDVDGKDKECLHRCVWENGELVAYIRILPPGLAYKEPSMGRFVVRKSYRGKGLGREGLTTAIEYVFRLYPNETYIRISGQAYLRKFYESLGFAVTKGPYYEDKIEHYELLLEKSEFLARTANI